MPRPTKSPCAVSAPPAAAGAAAIAPSRRRGYDSAATRQTIADAAVRMLLEHGFTGLGINALASAAAVDKQLIYYHFGGIDGVIRHIGAQVDLWLGAPLKVQPGEPYGQAARRLLLEYLEALRRNPVLLRLLSWEIAEPSPTLAELEQARSLALRAWVDGLRSQALPPPAGIDTPAIHAVLLAAAQHLTLREHAVGSFAGVELRGEAARQRIADAITFIVDRVYAPEPASSTPNPRT